MSDLPGQRGRAVNSSANTQPVVGEMRGSKEGGRRGEGEEERRGGRERRREKGGEREKEQQRRGKEENSQGSYVT